MNLKPHPLTFIPALYNEQHRELPTILTQFPIVLLRVKTPPFLLQFFRRIVSNRVVTIYNRYFGNDKGWGLFEAWRCINLLLYEA